MTRDGLGSDFNRLLSATVTSNLGDGLRVAAGPLLVASVTTNPVLVAAAAFVQQLPWVLASLPVGAWIDRLDRRTVAMGVDIGRAAVAGILTTVIAFGVARLPLLYAVLFIVGLAEVIADSASAALVPSVVTNKHLARANARLGAAFVVGNQFAGPPLGAWLFVVGAAWPFGAEAAAFAIAAFILAGIGRRPAPVVVERRDRSWLYRDVREGLAWTWHEDAVRLLAVVLCVMNVTFTAAFAVWVLYARQRLGVTGAGFGLLLTASAVGGLAGAALGGRLMEQFGAATLLRAGLVVETIVHVVLAVTRNAWVAGVVMVAFGVHAAVWGMVAATVRQRLVPDRLRGRVGSVYSLLVMGGSAVGAVASGFLARTLGLAGPFWVAAAVDTALLLAVWRRLVPARLERPPTPEHERRTGHQ